MAGTRKPAAGAAEPDVPLLDGERPEDAAAATREPEVRPEELTQGGGEIVGASAFSADVVAELGAPLDPNRVRRRQGRGSTQYEYLAGHDVYRRANQIFGFGNWGTEVVDLTELAAVQVQSNTGAKGWHVGYRCTVRLTVHGAVPVTGVGYGDGVEYTAGARVAACELAIKESETDAIKRAFTKLGDQFGLILYAKDDEKKRIQRDDNVGESREAVRVDPPRPKPQNWAEAMQRLEVLLGTGEGTPWLEELVEVRWGVPSIKDLPAADRQAAFVGFCSAVMECEVQLVGEPGLDPELRAKVAQAFGSKNEGVVLEGPLWALSAAEAETGMPAKEDVLAGGGEALSDAPAAAES